MYLINSHNGIKKTHVKRINIPLNFPVIYKHLLNFLPNVQERTDRGDDWTNLRNCAYLEDFEKPKIIWGEISDEPKFTFDNSNFYAEATTFLMTGEKLKYMLAILNSKISKWYFKQIGTTTGMGTNRWKKYKVELLPIKEANSIFESKIEKLVNEILSLKSQDSKADTQALEQEIDVMVYELYGLTVEEIAIVENS